MSHLVNQRIQLAPSGSVGNARFSAHGFEKAPRIAVEFVVEAVGATPTVTFNVQGLLPGGDEAVATDWVTLAVLQADATVATSTAGVVVTAVGRHVRYVDGLDLRFFDSIAVLTSANTNVTFRANAYPATRH